MRIIGLILLCALGVEFMRQLYLYFTSDDDGPGGAY